MEKIRVFPNLFGLNIKSVDFKKFSKKCVFLNLLICMRISINLQKNMQILGKRLRKVLTAPYSSWHSLTSSPELFHLKRFGPL